MLIIYACFCVSFRSLWGSPVFNFLMSSKIDFYQDTLTAISVAIAGTNVLVCSSSHPVWFVYLFDRFTVNGLYIPK